MRLLSCYCYNFTQEMAHHGKRLHHREPRSDKAGYEAWKCASCGAVHFVRVAVKRANQGGRCDG
jgi:hypothetical protein